MKRIKEVDINENDIPAKEKTEKKLKPFFDVKLQYVADNILEFYTCKTGNEKKRFLTDIEKFVNEIPITTVSNSSGGNTVIIGG